MRMWNVRPGCMCRNHLLGEHLEMHMFAGAIKNNISVAGYASSGLVDVRKIKSRHDDLAKEMKLRGYAHKSPLLARLIRNYKGPGGFVSVSKSKTELRGRCRECRKLLQE